MSYRPATPAQLDFIDDLIRDVYGDGSDEAVKYLVAVQDMTERDVLSTTRASEMITNLKKLRSEKRAQSFEGSVLQPDVPWANRTGPDIEPLGGYYAVYDGDKLRFFVVDHPHSAKWHGWVFVNEVIGPDEFRVGSQAPGEGYKGKYSRLMERILAEPVEAMALYGKEIGRCGRCGLRLTTEESRAWGIGPECRKALGYG